MLIVRWNRDMMRRRMQIRVAWLLCAGQPSTASARRSVKRHWASRVPFRAAHTGLARHSTSKQLTKHLHFHFKEQHEFHELFPVSTINVHVHYFACVDFPAFLPVGTAALYAEPRPPRLGSPEGTSVCVDDGADDPPPLSCAAGAPPLVDALTPRPRSYGGSDEDFDDSPKMRGTPGLTPARAVVARAVEPRVQQDRQTEGDGRHGADAVREDVAEGAAHGRSY